MQKSFSYRRACAGLAGALSIAALGLPLPSLAANSVSLGHGVKCTWVLVKTDGVTNVYKQICSRGI